jgi:septal ring factor EnvC (AmiA/AmiB activator)
MESTPNLFYLGLIIEMGILIVAAVWAVAKIRSTTETLGTQIRSLGTDINALRRVIERLETRQYDQAKEIASLQAKVDNHISE